MTSWHTSADGSPGDALALLEQALAEQALASAGQPGRRAAGEGVSLVDAMPFLIQLASADDDAIATAKRSMAVDADAAALRIAAMQCLREHYLRHADDPYRVLGLNPWAAEPQVRERYRKLIRLFHPDRGALHEDADTTLAANLNLAYARAGQQRQGTANVASSASSASSSAATTTSTRSSHRAERSRSGSTSASQSHRQRSASAVRWWRWMNPLVWVVAIVRSLGLLRLRRATIWTVLVLIGAAVVGIAWLADRSSNQHRWLVVQHDQPAIRPTPPAFLPDPAPLDERLAQEINTQQAAPVAAEPPRAAADERPAMNVGRAIQLTSPSLSAKVATATAAGVPVNAAAATPATAASRSVPKVAAAEKRVAVASTVAPPAPAVVAIPPQPTQPTPTVQAAPAAQAAPAVRASITPPAATTVAVRLPAEQPTPLPAVRPFSASADDIERFLAHFLGSYADGDLDQLLSLMQENMSYDAPGGKAAARRNYQRLFQSSSSRDLILRDVVWNRYGERIVASPRFEERVTLRNNGETQYQKGVMHIELIDQGGKITIGALSHKTLGQTP